MDNVLPDAPVIRTHIADRVGAASARPFDLLHEIGRDCVGALQFLPQDVDPATVDDYSRLEPLSERQVADILRNLGRTPLGLVRNGPLRISIAGAQEKTAPTMVDGVWHIPRGTMATTHIFKPAIGMTHGGLDLSLSAENELYCLRLLANCGLSTAKALIAHFEGIRTLVVERFDRRWRPPSPSAPAYLLRLPQEVFCQAMGMPRSQKYEVNGGTRAVEIANVLSSGSGAAEVEHFFLTQTMFWLLAATDGHAKNFSIYLRKGGALPIHAALRRGVGGAEPACRANPRASGQIGHVHQRQAAGRSD